MKTISAWNNFFLTCLLALCLLAAGCSADRSYHKQYRIARDPSFYPLELGHEEKYVFAFSDDLLMQIAMVESLHLELIPTSWDNLLLSLDQKKCDGILSSLPQIAQYAARYAFSEPYLLLGPVLVVLQNAPYTSLKEMEGRIIGVEAGSEAVIIAEKFPTLIFRSYEDLAQALQDLSQSEIDGVLAPHLMAQEYTHDLYHGVLKVAGPPMGDLSLRLITMKGQNEELIQRFNRGMESLIKSGQYYKLLQKWRLQG